MDAAIKSYQAASSKLDDIKQSPFAILPIKDSRLDGENFENYRLLVQMDIIERYYEIIRDGSGFHGSFGYKSDAFNFSQELTDNIRDLLSDTMWVHREGNLNNNRGIYEQFVRSIIHIQDCKIKQLIKQIEEIELICDDLDHERISPMVH